MTTSPLSVVVSRATNLVVFLGNLLSNDISLMEGAPRARLSVQVDGPDSPLRPLTSNEEAHLCAWDLTPEFGPNSAVARVPPLGPDEPVDPLMDPLLGLDASITVQPMSTLDDDSAPLSPSVPVSSLQFEAIFEGPCRHPSVRRWMHCSHMMAIMGRPWDWDH